MLLLVVSLACIVGVWGGYVGNSTRLCRQGPPLGPAGDGLANVVVLGDSVSIGWEPPLATLLADIAQVQHAPFSTDGGALDTKYQVQCAENLLTLSDNTPTTYDLVLYNSGLHDVNYSSQYPTEYTNVTAYKANLVTMVGQMRRLAGVEKVVWVDTTPVPFNKTRDELVLEYNAAARGVLSSAVAFVPLHQFVIDICGPVPYLSCNISSESPSHPGPHYTPQGYQMLAAEIEKYARPVILDILAQKRAKNAKLETAHLPQPVSGAPPVPCGTFSYQGATFQANCPAASTCAPSTWSNTGWTCCDAGPNPVLCGDNWNCCPQGTTCHQCSLTGCDCV